MKSAPLNDTTSVLRLDRGDDIHATIHQFCANYGIANAAVSGIGSVENPTLAHYSIETKLFTERKLDGIFEITSLLGNVGLTGDEPTAHLHVTISDIDMQPRAGHLVQGVCSATLELIITAYPSRHTKALDDTVGLKIWQLAS